MAVVLGGGHSIFKVLGEHLEGQGPPGVAAQQSYAFVLGIHQRDNDIRSLDENLIVSLVTESERSIC